MKAFNLIMTLNNILHKYTLGTAQLGIIGYGVNNNEVTVDANSMFNIILENNITKVDSSVLYGNINKLLNSYDRKHELEIYTKVTSISDIDLFFSETNLDTITGCYIHHFSDYETNPALLNKLQEDSRISNIGFSLYYPAELQKLLDNDIKFNMVQIPFNVFDRRFEPYFEILNQKGIEINVRSVFLQGLFFKENNLFNDSILDEYVSSKINLLKNIAKKYSITMMQLCYLFVASNQYVSQVLVGTDTSNQLQKNISEIYHCNVSHNVLLNIYSELKQLTETNEQIILPIKWKNQ